MTAVCILCGADVTQDEAGRWIDQCQVGLDDPGTRCPDGARHEVTS